MEAEVKKKINKPHQTKKQTCFDYFETPKDLRITPELFRAKWHVTYKLYYYYSSLHRKEHPEFYVDPNAAPVPEVVEKKTGYDSAGELTKRTKEMDEALIEACKKGSPQALTLYYKLQGRLVEKADTKVAITVSADDIYAARAKAQNRQQQSIPGRPKSLPAGDREVCGESALLPDEVRQTPEQGNGESDPLATVALSDQNA